MLLLLDYYYYYYIYIHIINNIFINPTNLFIYKIYNLWIHNFQA